MSQLELEEARNKITELVEQGFIKKSSNSWDAPALLVIKKNGTLYFCVDYRALNHLTIKKRFPLPRIDELLDSLKETKYFSKVDWMMGNHEIQLSDKSIPE